MNRLRKIASVLILTIILALSITNNVFAADKWTDYMDNDKFMSEDINTLAEKLCGQSMSFAGEGSWTNWDNAACIDPNTGSQASSGFKCAGIIDITGDTGTVYFADDNGQVQTINMPASVAGTIAYVTNYVNENSLNDGLRVNLIQALMSECYPYVKDQGSLGQVLANYTNNGHVNYWAGGPTQWTKGVLNDARAYGDMVAAQQNAGGGNGVGLRDLGNNTYQFTSLVSDPNGKLNASFDVQTYGGAPITNYSIVTNTGVRLAPDANLADYMSEGDWFTIESNDPNNPVGKSEVTIQTTSNLMNGRMMICGAASGWPQARIVVYGNKEPNTSISVPSSGAPVNDNPPVIVVEKYDAEHGNKLGGVTLNAVIDDVYSKTGEGNNFTIYFGDLLAADSELVGELSDPIKNNAAKLLDPKYECGVDLSQGTLGKPYVYGLLYGPLMAKVTGSPTYQFWAAEVARCKCPHGHQHGSGNCYKTYCDEYCSGHWVSCGQHNPVECPDYQAAMAAAVARVAEFAEMYCYDTQTVMRWLYEYQFHPSESGLVFGTEKYSIPYGEIDPIEFIHSAYEFYINNLGTPLKTSHLLKVYTGDLRVDMTEVSTAPGYLLWQNENTKFLKIEYDGGDVVNPMDIYNNSSGTYKVYTNDEVEMEHEGTKGDPSDGTYDVTVIKCYNQPEDTVVLEINKWGELTSNKRTLDATFQIDLKATEKYWNGQERVKNARYTLGTTNGQIKITSKDYWEKLGIDVVSRWKGTIDVTIKELRTDGNYILWDHEKSFRITYKWQGGPPSITEVSNEKEGSGEDAIVETPQGVKVKVDAYNTPKSAPQIVIQKNGLNNSGLKGAIFDAVITRLDNGASMSMSGLTTNQTGQIIIYAEDLDNFPRNNKIDVINRWTGTLRIVLTETKAPDGYKRIEEPIVVNVRFNEGKIVSVDCSNQNISASTITSNPRVETIDCTRCNATGQITKTTNGTRTEVCNTCHGIKVPGSNLTGYICKNNKICTYKNGRWTGAEKTNDPAFVCPGCRLVDFGFPSELYQDATMDICSGCGAVLSYSNMELLKEYDATCEYCGRYVTAYNMIGNHFYIACDDCDGVGTVKKEYSQEILDNCPDCNGSGKITRVIEGSASSSYQGVTGTTPRTSYTDNGGYEGIAPTGTIAIKDKLKNELRIRKVDGDTVHQDYLGDEARFKVTVKLSPNGSFVGQSTEFVQRVDSRGYIDLTKPINDLGVDLGEYSGEINVKMQELEGPNGYLDIGNTLEVTLVYRNGYLIRVNYPNRDDLSKAIIDVGESEDRNTVTIAIKNTKYELQPIHISKVDSQTGRTLYNVDFKVTIATSEITDNMKSVVYSTSDDGLITIPKKALEEIGLNDWYNGEVYVLLEELGTASGYKHLDEKVYIKVEYDNGNIKSASIVRGASVADTTITTVQGKKILKISVKNERALPDLIINKVSLSNGNAQIVESAVFNVKVSVPGSQPISKRETVGRDGKIIFSSKELETLGINGRYTGNITVDIIEESVSGAVKIPEPIQVVISVENGVYKDSKVSNETHAAVVSNIAGSVVNIKIRNDIVQEDTVISGIVWEETATTKASETLRDGKYTTSSWSEYSDKLFEGIEVTLYQKTGNGLTLVTNLSGGTNPTLTDSQGYYEFHVPMGSGNYVVKFTYNGQEFTASGIDSQNGTVERTCNGPFTKTERCIACQGTGKVEDTSTIRTCEVCNGTKQMNCRGVHQYQIKDKVNVGYWYNATCAECMQQFRVNTNGTVKWVEGVCSRSGSYKFYYACSQNCAEKLEARLNANIPADEHKVTCTACNGKGTIGSAINVDCSNCSGRGYRTVVGTCAHGYTANHSYYEVEDTSADNSTNDIKVTSKGSELNTERAVLNERFYEIRSYPANYIMKDRLFDSRDLPSTNNLAAAYESGYNTAYRYNELEDVYEKVKVEMRNYLAKVKIMTDEKAGLKEVYTNVVNNYYKDGNRLKDNEIYNKLQFIYDSRLNAYAGSYTKAGGVESLAEISTYSASSKDINAYQRFVNLGIYRRDKTDLTLKKDLYESTVSMNRYDETYNYNTGKTDYKQYVYEEDYNYYKEANSNGIAWYQDDQVELYLKYKITVQNTTNVMTKLTEVADYFDSRFGYNDSYTTTSGATLKGVEAFKITENGKEPISGVSATAGGKYIPASRIGLTGTNDYAELFVTFANGQEPSLKDGERVEIYVTVKLGKDGENGRYKVNDRHARNSTWASEILKTAINDPQNLEKTLSIYNYAEVNGYITLDNNGKPAGYLDSDSKPGTFIVKDFEGARAEYLEAYKDKKSNPERFAATLDEVERIRQDDVWSVRLDLKNNLTDLKNSYYHRTINGNVWEAITNEVKTSTNLYNNTLLTYIENNGLKGIVVELVEVEPGGQQYVRARTVTGDKGGYSFSGYIAGDYSVRFVYGEEARDGYTEAQNNLMKETSVNGGSGNRGINGQYYQSTKANPDTDKVEYWYAKYAVGNDGTVNYEADSNPGVVGTENKLRYSDAYDEVTSRINQISARTAGTNANAAQGTVDNSWSWDYEWDGVENVQQRRHLDTIEAYTSTMKIEIEYTKKNIKGDEDNKFYRYKVDEVDFGVTPRAIADLNIDKYASNVKLHLQNGEVQLDVDLNPDGTVKQYNNDPKYQNIVLPLDGSLTYRDGILDVSLDTGLLNGTTLEVTYTVTVSNNGERNYITYFYDTTTITKDTEPVALAYYNGYNESLETLVYYEQDRQAENITKPVVKHDTAEEKFSVKNAVKDILIDVRTRATNIIDYIDPNLNFAQANIKGEAVNSDWVITTLERFNSTRENAEYSEIMSKYNTIIRAVGGDTYESYRAYLAAVANGKVEDVLNGPNYSSLYRPLLPGESISRPLMLTKVLETTTTTGTNDYIYSNLIELARIENYAGKIIDMEGYDITGTNAPETSKIGDGVKTLGTSKSETIIIHEATGLGASEEYKSNLGIILIALVTFAGGLFLIKKFVLTPKAE